MDQIVVFLALGIALVLFSWGAVRHDFVALIALLIVVIAGVVPPGEAFLGFGHPAVVTVISVLIISKALQNSGLIEVLAHQITRFGKKAVTQILILTFFVGIASAFMNNVGALAIMMPVAIHLAGKNNYPPSHVLMPIAFASLLGGMTTLIGTPPNIIVASFRGDAMGTPFSLFDFAPAGIGVAAAGLLFVAVLGWRFLPVRLPQSESDNLFQIDDYITEARITKDSILKGRPIGEIQALSKSAVRPLGLVRRGRRIHAPDPSETLKTNDILIIETDTDELKTFVANSGARLVGGKKFRRDAAGSKDILIMEVVVMADSPLIGETAASLNMRSRYGINLLAVAQRGNKIRLRIDNTRFQAGDVLLLQGRSINIRDAITAMQCLPLAEREITIGRPRKIVLALGIFGTAVVSVVTGLLPVHVAFPLAALILVLTNVLSFHEVYTSVDWPVVVLLGAMIPVGIALETSGGAARIASVLLSNGSRMPVWVSLTIVLAATMLLSNIINNAATAVLMAPIGITVATGLNVSIDPFLMAVAVGASSAFLTPIGHQSNTLVMGPGGYRFNDYWRMGLPLTILIAVLGVPLILFFWPL
ncbi:MAG TPA: SLC13 family permease [Syntrophales bacterium]|nr:SLC13 family permease [Syntrophales bacterium]HQB30287.1 SLC13 family permease [Syntrophales bacterium]HQN77801.1 SLC13 family permease [Syntrophales bacterium]HQQ27340.1 SLC13 family permease [Syntrophales bacterium]